MQFLTKNAQQFTNKINAMRPYLERAKKSCQENIKKLQEPMTQEAKTSFKEMATLASVGLVGGVAINQMQKNPDAISLDKFAEYFADGTATIIPASFLLLSTQEAREDVLRNVENIRNIQSGINDARYLTSKISPVFTLVPKAAKVGFGVTTALAGLDVIVIGGLNRVFQMVEMRPDIIPDNRKKEYDAFVKKLTKHMVRELTCDGIKIVYRGQIVIVNKKLSENEKPQKEYVTPFLKKKSEQRLIPLKNNLGVVGSVLPVSMGISQVAAEDTKAFKETLKDFENFMKEIVDLNDRHLKDSYKQILEEHEDVMVLETMSTIPVKTREESERELQIKIARLSVDKDKYYPPVACE